MNHSVVKTCFVRVTAVLFLTAGLGACATLGGGTPEEVVAKRAQAYWDARLSGDVAKTRSYTNQAFQQTVDEKRFASRHMATFARSAKVASVKCEAQKCDVTMALGVQPPMMGQSSKPIEMGVNQTWLQEDGQWRLFLEP